MSIQRFWTFSLNFRRPFQVSNTCCKKNQWTCMKPSGLSIEPNESFWDYTPANRNSFGVRNFSLILDTCVWAPGQILWCSSKLHISFFFSFATEILTNKSTLAFNNRFHLGPLINFISFIRTWNIIIWLSFWLLASPETHLIKPVTHVSLLGNMPSWERNVQEPEEAVPGLPVRKEPSYCQSSDSSQFTTVPPSGQ